MVYSILATLAFALLVLGWTQRRRRRRHVPLVLGGIGIDLTVVVMLEVGRGVLGMAIHDEWSLLQILHIGLSSLAVLLYLPTLGLGITLLRGKGGVRVRTLHRRFATSALAARTAGFLFMWSVV